MWSESLRTTQQTFCNLARTVSSYELTLKCKCVICRTAGKGRAGHTCPEASAAVVETAANPNFAESDHPHKNLSSDQTKVASTKEASLLPTPFSPAQGSYEGFSTPWRIARQGQRPAYPYTPQFGCREAEPLHSVNGEMGGFFLQRPRTRRVATMVAHDHSCSREHSRQARSIIAKACMRTSKNAPNIKNGRLPRTFARGAPLFIVALRATYCRTVYAAVLVLQACGCRSSWR